MRLVDAPSRHQDGQCHPCFPSFFMTVHEARAAQQQLLHALVMRLDDCLQGTQLPPLLLPSPSLISA